MEVFAHSGDCKICFKVVTMRQHALECDNCQRWVHRLCGTGITYTQYRGIMDNLRHGGTVPWMCQSCTVEARRAAVAADDDIDNRDNHGVSLDVLTTDIRVPAFESMRLDAAIQSVESMFLNYC